MNPIIAKDAVIMFKKNDTWLPYQCASDVEVSFKLETKSVKTIGDGNHRKPRGQVIGHQISTGALIKFDDETYPHSFDLLAYLIAMTPIEYRLVFTTEDSSQLRKIEGLALPTEVTLGGGSEGFAYGNVTLAGDGAPLVIDVLDTGCSAEITDGEMVVIGANNGFQINSLTGGPITRYDWSVNGGGRSAAFVDGTLPDQFTLGSLWPTGTALLNTLTVWPICENGYDGEPFEIPFTSDPVS